MSFNPLLNRKLLSLCGPAMGVVLAYYVSFHSSLQKIYIAEYSKLQKLEAANERRAKVELSAQKLASAQVEIKSLNEQLARSRAIGTHLVARRADLRSEYLRSNSPATVMAETLELLSRNHLECIESAPASATDSNGVAVSEPLKPVAELLGGVSAAKNEVLDRREIRVTLRGRFQDMQSALREIQVAPLGIFTVSLEMENSDAHTDVHTWILTISV